MTLAASFGCPYEGEVGVDRLQGVIEAVVAGGPTELTLADSIGVAVPTDVRERVGVARDVIGDRPITLRTHFHNSRNTGLANAATAVEVGVSVLDSSLGGVGGCPFAPQGDRQHPHRGPRLPVASDGVSDRDRPSHALCDVAEWIETALGHPVPGFLAKAGIFPDSVTTARAASVA